MRFFIFSFFYFSNFSTSDNKTKLITKNNTVHNKTAPIANNNIKTVVILFSPYSTIIIYFIKYFKNDLNNLLYIKIEIGDTMDKNKYILDETPRPKTWADGGRQCPYCHEIIDPGEHHVCKPKAEEKPVNKQVQKPAPKPEPKVKEKPEDKPVKNARPGDPDDKGYTIDEPDDDRTHGNYESHNEQVIANLKSLEIGDCLREMENLLSMDADFLNESVLNEKAKTVLRGEGDNTTDESKRLTKNFVYKMSSDKVKAKELELEKLKEIYKKTKNPKIKANIERKKVELKKIKYENSANFHAKVVANNSETNDQNMYEDYLLDIKNDYTLDEGLFNFNKNKNTQDPEENIIKYIRQKIKVYKLLVCTDEIEDKETYNYPLIKNGKLIDIWGIYFNVDLDYSWPDPYWSGGGGNYGYAAIDSGKLILSKAIFELDNKYDYLFSKSGITSTEINNPNIFKFIDNFFNDQNDYFHQFHNNKNAQKNIIKRLVIDQHHNNLFKAMYGDDFDEDYKYGIDFSFILDNSFNGKIYVEKSVKDLVRLKEEAKYTLDIKNDYTLDEAKNLAQPGHATSVTSNNNRLDYAKQAMENRKDQLSRQQEVLNAQKEKLMQEKEKNAEKIKNIENNVTDAETKKNMISAVNNNTEIKNNQIKSKEERVKELSGDKKEAQETFEVVKNRAEKSLRESFEFTYDELLQEDEAPAVSPVKEPEKVKEPKQPKVKPASVKEIVVSISLGRYGQLEDIDIHSTEDNVNFSPLVSKIRGSQKLRKICFDRKRLIDSNEDNAAYRTSALLKKALRSEIRSFMADENVKLHKVSIVVESVETNDDEEILTEAKYPTVRDLAFGGETGKIIDVVINNTDYPANPEYKQIASKLKRSTVFKNLLFKYKRELDRVNPSRETLTGLKFKIKSEITKCKKNK